MRPIYFDHQITSSLAKPWSPDWTWASRGLGGLDQPSTLVRITAESWRRRHKPLRRSDNSPILRGC